MNRTKIEWADWTWNPIRGLCPVDCKLPDGRSYCYAMRMYQRFKWNPEIRLDCEDKSKLGTALSIKTPRKPSKIFVCSTIELFHPKIKKHWRDWIFREIEKNPQHTFQILTKFPQNIDRPMPDNVWLGVTVTGQGGNSERNRLDVFQDIEAKIKFISYEPILGEVSFEDKDKIDWLIMGALTGYSYKNRYRPHIVYLQILIHSYQRDGTKIFLKNNLKDIWKGKLIQEFPK